MFFFLFLILFCIWGDTWRCKPISSYPVWLLSSKWFKSWISMTNYYDTSTWVEAIDCVSVYFPVAYVWSTRVEDKIQQPCVRRKIQQMVLSYIWIIHTDICEHGGKLFASITIASSCKSGHRATQPNWGQQTMNNKICRVPIQACLIELIITAFDQLLLFVLRFCDDSR